MSRKNIADNEDLVFQALDSSISSVNNTQSVRLGLGEDSESDLDVFEDSSSELDDNNADIGYYPSSDNESDSSNTNVGLMFTSTPKKPKKRTHPELQGNQKRSPIYSDHSSPDIDDPDMKNNDDELVPVDVRLLDPPPIGLKLGLTKISPLFQLDTTNSLAQNICFVLNLA
ncbi:hypothetical protein J6590_019084 [Homalodisca vitripennis]|nr:hypothetical protein J6590_019084 [Homalodisca vitripennis]